MILRPWCVALCALAISTLSACSGGGNGASPSPSPAASTAPSPTATIVASPAPSPTATAGVKRKTVSFSDIGNDFGKQAITDLGQIGVLDSTSGQFKPDAPITRAEFVRWLVKANNIYEKDPTKQIRLAKNGPAQFVDVPPGNANFPYIQGLANAGFVIGVDAKHFAPNASLTREQMIAIKAQLDEGSDIKSGPDDKMFLSDFSDVNKINNRYTGAIHEDFSVRTTRNIGRVWGKIKMFQPQKPVTRSEAAIAISEIDSASAAVVLGRTPPPETQ